MDNNKIKRIWNLVSVPFAFFLGAAYMWIGETGVGCIFILFATNEIIKNNLSPEATAELIIQTINKKGSGKSKSVR